MTYSVYLSKHGGMRVWRGRTPILSIVWNSALKWGIVTIVNAPRTIVCYSEEELMKAIQEAVTANAL